MQFPHYTKLKIGVNDFFYHLQFYYFNPKLYTIIESHRIVEKWMQLLPTLLILTLSCTLTKSYAQHTRTHTITQSHGIEQLVPANEPPTESPQVSLSINDQYRIIRSNGIPDHDLGIFPNQGNPHNVTSQNYEFIIPLNPTVAPHTTELTLHNFGVAMNGIPFDPGAAEWYRGDRASIWQYEALSGAISLGVDENHAHIQPSGAYHYHGLPTQLLNRLNISISNHSPIIGWAADGFPIYARFGYQDPYDLNSPIMELHSSYALKEGKRPNGDNEPGGYYDGTFLADYEYHDQKGELDECNGRFTKTPDFPEGTYAYFLTKDWPTIPRCFKGTPSSSFTQRGRNINQDFTTRHEGRRRRHPPPHHHQH